MEGSLIDWSNGKGFLDFDFVPTICRDSDRNDKIKKKHRRQNLRRSLSLANRKGGATAPKGAIEKLFMLALGGLVERVS